MRTRVLITILAVLALVALVWLVSQTIWVWPGQLSSIARGRADDNTYLKAVTDTRTSLLQAVAGLGVFLAAVVAALTLWFNRHAHKETLTATHKALEQTQAQTEATLELTRRGQVNERFAKAIEHLAEERNLDIRLGGIYALEQVARDAPELHAPIVEILCAFLRAHAHGPSDAYGPSRATSTPADWQAAVSVLGHREVPNDRRHLDLKGVYLPGCNFSRTNFTSSIFDQSKLLAATFEQAQLAGAQFREADLHLVNFRNADLTGANFSDSEGLTPPQLAAALSIQRATLPNSITFENVRTAKADPANRSHDGRPAPP